MAADANAANWSPVSFLDFFAKHADDVPHVAQSKVWDCGIACTEMVLRARGAKDISSSKLRASVGTESVWSIDLAYLLRAHGVDASLYTSIKGVRPEYEQQEFYRRQISEDTLRVTGLFADAQTHNVRVVEREITLREIRDAVYSRGELAVVLVDKRMLLCEYCSTPAKVKLACHAASPSPAGFLGHYVLVSRFHAETDVFLVKDSSSRCSTCVVRGSVLEKARTAFGTDHDTIIVRGCWR